MNIAIYNNFKGHNELYGYLMYLFKNENITLFYHSDIFNYIGFFENHFGKIEKQNINSFKNCFEKYDKIFVITMTSDLPGIFKNIQSNTYGIIHSHNRKSPFIKNYITLYPSQMIQYKNNK